MTAGALVWSAGDGPAVGRESPTNAWRVWRASAHTEFKSQRYCIGGGTAAVAGDAEDCGNATIAADRFAACRRLAEQGEAWAQCNLGYLYA
jgi:hypothetical protein